MAVSPSGLGDGLRTKILVTGGAGFIGCNFISLLLRCRKDIEIVNFDKLTYAGNLENLADCADHPQYRFVRGDIADPCTLPDTLAHGFDAVVNFAAETHVDRSIEDASPFLRSNVLGTHVLLDLVRQFRVPRFVQISTDEVYGSVGPGQEFDEDASLHPGSPYAASKAAADLLVHSYVNTYGVSALILRSTNNYGPHQFPEKLIPLAIANAMENKPIPVYGDGGHERDWLYVEDFCLAIARVLEAGEPGEIYNVSSGLTQPNLKVVQTILNILGKPETLLQFVDDRPGHDRRYALCSAKIRSILGWKPQVSFEEGMRRTIEWYQRKPQWLARVRSGEYQEYYERHYLHRGEKIRTTIGSAS